ncbi:BatA domain-containing protein [Roseimaritima sediminicola]|uniref:BatA domain-containing protein n=1 Tax=Roseimaritima sediminicola TaxID=2662066 RepID=UPI0012982FAF|nr:BatA domain-containing protein [Roseimaritima sediminicola]
MSWLAPAYLLGALAIGLPILFHLVRQRPRERMVFSSLMFLQPTPPRLTRRSRLDDLLLLALRILVILLLAFAFTRPFFRSDSATQWKPPGRDVLILVDTSASMRQTGVWDQVQRHVRETLDDLDTDDRVGLVAFDLQPRTLVDLASEDPEASAGEAIETAMRSLRPGWARGDLPRALTSAADQLDTVVGSQDANHEKRLVVISDLQAEPMLPDLQGFPWPADVEVQLKRVAAEATTNAAVSLLSAREGEADSQSRPAGRRARVYNSPRSQQAQFALRWIDAQGQPLEPRPISTNVPPGQTRVVRVPEPPRDAVALELTGDQQPFDNRWYVAEAEPQQQTLLFLGEDRSEPRESLSYYLQRAALDTPRRSISFQTAPAESNDWQAWEAGELAMVVVATPLAADAADPLIRWMDEGVNVLTVLAQPIEDPQAVEQFLHKLIAREETAAASLQVREAEVPDYALLGDIDFGDPLFSIFADPRFSDFSKIRFWSHRQINIPESDGAVFQTLARFDDGDPALLRYAGRRGQLWVLAAGWQPSASQLALSTKFLPLMARMMDANAGESRSLQRHFVGDPIPASATGYRRLPGPEGRGPEGRGPEGRGPEGRELDDSAEEPSPAAFDTPGRYQFDSKDSSRTLAFNVDPAESEWEPIDADVLASLDVRMAGAELTVEQRAQQERQKRDVELEAGQQWWRWLVVAALGVLLAESGWAAWRTRRM